jgi:hypothetical protein
MLDESTLRQLYLEEKRSIRDIAALKHVPTRTVYSLLIRYRIPRRPAGFRSVRIEPANVLFNEATLRRLYLAEQRSIRDIAALHQVSTRMVYDAMNRYHIPRRTVGYRRPPESVISIADRYMDVATLRRLYEEEGQSIAMIAQSVGCSSSRIRSALVRWKIPRRRRGRPYRGIAIESG